MKLFYDSTKAKEIEDKILKRFNEQFGHRNEVHLSDTCGCECKAYNRLTGMEPVYTKRVIGILVFGEIAGLFIQLLYPPEQREYESTDIVYSHVDVYEDFKYPLEVKSSSQKIFEAAKVPLAWVLQFKRYMAKHNADVGWLLILNLFSRQVTAFKGIMTVQERIDEIGQMRESRDRILYARDNEDPSGLVLKTDGCPGCFYKPSKKRRELGLGDGCTLYRSKRKKKT